MGVYQRPGSKNWYVRFQSGGKDIVTCAGQGVSKKDAEALLKELRGKARAKQLGIIRDGLLTDSLLEWIELGNLKDGGAFGLKPDSWKRYKVSIRQINRVIEGVMISDVGKRFVAGYVLDRQGQGRANRTIRRDLDALSAHYQWLDGQGRVEHNRVRDYDISQIPEHKTEISVPSVAQVQTIIDTFHRMPACFTAFQALSGLRQAEAEFAEWNEFDLDAGTLTIPKSKSTAPRTVHLFKSAIEILRSLPKPPNHKTDPRGGYIFWHGEGLPYRQFGSFWWEKVTNFLQMDVRDHDLRHFFAWLYLRRGGSIEGLKSQMGHLNITTTQQYAHMASDLAHWDLVMIGERTSTVQRNDKFDVRFCFDASGDFIGARAAQLRSRHLYARLRAEGKGAKARSKVVAPHAVPPANGAVT